jgi:hypothetical protein
MTSEDLVKGKRRPIKGRQKQKWSMFIYDEVSHLYQNENESSGLLQEPYGMSKLQTGNKGMRISGEF